MINKYRLNFSYFLRKDFFFLKMIILLGFPKSGTTSFQTLFEALGYNSIHWNIVLNSEHFKIGTIIKQNKERNLPLLYDINVDCITQMDICISESECYWPQITDYEQLYLENPDTIFILNRRDPFKLLSSLKRWFSYDKRILKFNPELLNQEITDDDMKILDLIYRHYFNIESFFKDKKFIDFDIEKDDISKLNVYIDTKSFSFPKENENNIKFL